LWGLALFVFPDVSDGVGKTKPSCCGLRFPWFSVAASTWDSALGNSIYELLYLFSGGDAPACEKSADFNDDGEFDLSDPLATFNFLFQGAAAPPPPFGECGTDATDDTLSCIEYAPCTP